jgi:predicted dehydrogenase
LKVIVVGLGVQGRKRRAVAGADFVAAVDPFNPEAQYRTLEEISPDQYDAALVCTPDEPKIEMLDYLVSRGKHALVEKPLWAESESDIQRLGRAARARGVVCYTAYNHRFEPHYVRMRDLVQSGRLGKLYHCSMFYGNGTARLVRDSAWRDRGAGVLPDLGSHLLDTAAYWFGDIGVDFDVHSARSFENRSPDHVVIGSRSSQPQLQLEMTLLSWRNHFTCDVFGEHGSAHIRSLCKWGPTTFTVRTRVVPSGRPPEDAITLVQDDPTWAAEYAHFQRLCERREPTDVSRDLWLHSVLRGLGDRAMQMAAS